MIIVRDKQRYAERVIQEVDSFSYIINETNKQGLVIQKFTNNLFCFCP